MCGEWRVMDAEGPDRLTDVPIDHGGRYTTTPNSYQHHSTGLGRGGMGCWVLTHLSK